MAMIGMFPKPKGTPGAIMRLEPAMVLMPMVDLRPLGGWAVKLSPAVVVSYCLPVWF